MGLRVTLCSDVSLLSHRRHSVSESDSSSSSSPSPSLSPPPAKVKKRKHKHHRKHKRHVSPVASRERDSCSAEEEHGTERKVGSTRLVLRPRYCGS